MQFNPFRPNNMAGPDMFVGRVPELLSIEKCLFQTKHGNPQHFLIEGERGIGKSSLFLYVKSLAQGRFTGLDFKDKFKFICVSVDLGKCKTQLHIIQNIAKGLKAEIAAKQEIKAKATAFWGWITQWEVMGVKFNHEDDSFDADFAGQELVSNLTKFFDEVNDIDGVLILLDEADAPESSADLGTFLKMTSERLQRNDCNQVVFGLAGLPPLLGRLKDSHESSPRLFEIMTLATLEVDERRRVVNNSVERANEANKTDLTINDDAMDELCNISEGYPHFLQQFGYCAFEANTDEVIDVGDVINGAFLTNGAIDQLGAKFFNDMYNARISSDDYRRVLDAMSIYSDGWIKRDVIRSDCGLADHTITNALRSLLAKDIIIKDESRKGFYRLPTKSFAVWINATKRKSVDKPDA